MSQKNKHNQIIIISACFFAFFVLGISTSILGPALPDLSIAIGISLASMGIIRAGRQIGQCIAIFVGGSLVDKYNSKALILLGAAVMGLGLIYLVISRNVVFAFMSAFLWGAGHGFIHIISTIIIGVSGKKTSSRLLTMLNTLYVIGAIAGPLLIECFRKSNWRGAFIFCSIACLFIGIVFLVLDLRQKKAPIHEEKTGENNGDLKLVAILALLMFLFNGANGGIADWIYTHVILITNSSSKIATQITSLYWLMQAVGRIITVFVVDVLGDKKTLTTGITLSIIGSIVLFISHTPIMIAIGVGMVSIGYAPIYPLVLAIGGKQEFKSSSSILGMLSSIAAFGAIVIPFVQGVIGEGKSGGMVITLVCSILMGATIVLMWLRDMVAHRSMRSIVSTMPILLEKDTIMRPGAEAKLVNE